jgi:hypothetical protein
MEPGMAFLLQKGQILQYVLFLFPVRMFMQAVPAIPDRKVIKLVLPVTG